MSDKRPYALLDRTFREEAGRLTALLVRLFGDFDLAEEAVADAVVEALEHWPRQGAPERPAAWLYATARRKGLDIVRRRAAYAGKLAKVAALPESPSREPDDRLRLIFTCCHPALAPEARISLTLRAVAGLTTTEIARGFLVPERTIARRITRAKQKISTAGVAYAVPGPDDLADRLDSVLTVIYMIFNEGYVATSGRAPIRRDLAADAAWLAGLLVGLLPAEPEPLGLLALVQAHLARWPARLTPDGDLVVLADQDRSAWDRRLVQVAERNLNRAAAVGPVGRFQVEAAIALLHAQAPSWAATDWPQISALYGLLMMLDPSPVVHLNRAIATSQVDGPHVALTQVDQLTSSLERYHLFHTTRAWLLRQVGRGDEADVADRHALNLTDNPAERHLIATRLRSTNEARLVRGYQLTE